MKKQQSINVRTTTSCIAAPTDHNNASYITHLFRISSASCSFRAATAGGLYSLFLCTCRARCFLMRWTVAVARIKPLTACPPISCRLHHRLLSAQLMLHFWSSCCCCFRGRGGRDVVVVRGCDRSCLEAVLPEDVCLELIAGGFNGAPPLGAAAAAAATRGGAGPNARLMGIPLRMLVCLLGLLFAIALDICGCCF